MDLVKPLVIWSLDEMKSICSSVLATLSSKMIVNFNVLCVPMKHMIRWQVFDT
jgi:hypothetical protein